MAFKNLSKILLENFVSSKIIIYAQRSSDQQQPQPQDDIRRPRKYSLLVKSGRDFQCILDSTLSPTVQLQPDNTRSPPLNKYQYAIYELFNAEINIYCNINKMIHFYQKPMLSYRLISDEESTVIFFDLKHLANIHLNLIKNLAHLQTTDGTFGCPTAALSEFIESLHFYEAYCLNLANSKSTLRKKMQQKPFSQFLQSEQIRECGEKLDLASHLDQPRRHLMKYPLMLSEIGRRAVDQQEIDQLKSLYQQFVAFINSIDGRIAAKKYQDLYSRLVFSPKRLSIQDRIQTSCNRLVMCTEVRLRNRKRWTKNCLILLDQMLLLAKCSTLSAGIRVILAIDNGCDLNYHYGEPKSSVCKPRTAFISNERIRKMLPLNNQNQQQQQQYRRRYSLGNSSMTTTTTANHHNNSNHNNGSKWLHLYTDCGTVGHAATNTHNSIRNSIVSRPNCERKFDVFIKFNHHDDSIIWIRKLATCFNLIAK